MLILISHVLHSFWLQLGCSLVLRAGRKVLTGALGLFGRTKGSFGTPDNAARVWERTQRGIVVPCFAAQGLQPRQSLLLLESYPTDEMWVLFALLNCKDLMPGPGGRKSGLEMQAVAQVCSVEYNEDAFQAWLVFNQFFRQRWPREMFELSWWWLCNLMQASCVREASILPDECGQKCAASRFVGSVCAWLRCSLSA